MAPNVMPVGPSLELGEGPYWDDESQVLFYVDIYKHAIHSYKPETDEHHVVSIDVESQPVSLIVKVKGKRNKFLISIKSSLAVIEWDGVSANPIKPEYVVNLESDDNSTAINDGKCDPSNRLWAGTMSIVKGGKYEVEKGSLYSFQHGKEIVKHLSKLSMSNGLAWSPDKTKFYYIDSLKYKIDSYDYDDTSGSISNEKTVFCFKSNKIEGLPDGMTIDQEGMLWVACFAGSQVLRIDPRTGEVKFTLKIPSYQVTSVCFGGPQLEDLYVTSAKINFTDEQEEHNQTAEKASKVSGLNFTKDLEENYPLAGKAFRVTGLEVKGTPSLPVELCAEH